MIGTRTLLRTLASVSLGFTLMVPLGSAPAQADPVINVWADLEVVTTLAKPGITVRDDAGYLAGSVDADTGAMFGELRGDVQTSGEFQVGKLPFAAITVQVRPAAPLRGTFDMGTNDAQASGSFDVQVVSVRPIFFPEVNLISGPCTTAKPAIVRIDGPIDAYGVSAFLSSFSLSKFENCGKAASSSISTALSGPTNVMQIRMSNVYMEASQ